MQSESLADFCEPKGGLTYGWGSVVRPRLQEKVSELAAQKRSLQTYQTQALELVVAHIEAQVDALDLMARLIEEYKVSLQPKLDLARKDYLLAFCEAQVLKVARLQSEIRVDTYTPHTTPALTKIRELVMEEKLKTETELEKLQGMLNQFEAAGPALLEVAQQYAAISKELEDKEWALHKVREDV